MFHQPFGVDLPVIDVGDDAIDAFRQVMGCDVGGHPHGNTGRAVDQQVGYTGGQHCRLLEGIVEIKLEVHRLLVDITQHLFRQPVQTGLGVTHGRGAVAIHASHVTLSVHQGIAHAPVLGQSHHGIVYRRVAVWVVLTQHFSHDSGGFLMGLVGRVTQLRHPEKDAAVHRLESVAHVG